MEVIYAHEEMPERFSKSIFLAGPTPRSDDVESWRKDALKILEDKGFDGVVFVPEPRDGKWSKDYDAQIEWEDKHLNLSDVIMFWIPRNLKTMPGLTTNIEWGRYESSGRVVFGAPKDAPKNDYLKFYADKFNVPVAETLTETLENALERLGDGSAREGGERFIPLYIWNTPSFQSWYKAQKNAGNELKNARVSFTIRPNNKEFVFLWGIHPEMYIGSEDRMKINETVIARTDISSVLLWKPADPIDDTEIVIIKEYRAPASTEDCFIREIVGGSSTKSDDPMEVAADEVREEAGLIVNINKLKFVGARQLAGTLSSHKSFLYSYKLDDEELKWLKSQAGIIHGNIEESERTYIEVLSLKELKNNLSIDWTNLGMIMSVIYSFI